MLVKRETKEQGKIWNRRRRRTNHKFWSQKKVMGASMSENRMNKPDQEKERERTARRAWFEP